MSQAFEHRPVMASEVVTLFGTVPPGLVIDGTLGGGGHTRLLLDAYPRLRVAGIDRDRDALAAARATLAGFAAEGRVSFHHARFDAIGEVARAEGAGPGELSGVLLDLGVSSPQLDRPERGFTYRSDAPLDMRMDTEQARTAADVVNTWDERSLARLFAENGERFATRVARAVVAARPLATTGQLVDVIRAAIPAPARRAGGHPAKRVFQAIRIAVNDELDILAPTLDAAIDLLAPGGRLVVLAYHSGEDRIVKERFLQAATGGCVCPAGLPCVCGAVPTVRLLTRGARKPTRGEIERNPRAESARLRAVERLAPATAATEDDDAAQESPR